VGRRWAPAIDSNLARDVYVTFDAVGGNGNTSGAQVQNDCHPVQSCSASRSSRAGVAVLGGLILVSQRYDVLSPKYGTRSDREALGHGDLSGRDVTWLLSLFWHCANPSPALRGQHLAARKAAPTVSVPAGGRTSINIVTISAASVVVNFWAVVV